MCVSHHGFSKDGISMNSKGQPDNIPPPLQPGSTNVAGVQGRSAGANVDEATPVPSSETAEYVSSRRIDLSISAWKRVVFRPCCKIYS